MAEFAGAFRANLRRRLSPNSLRTFMGLPTHEEKNHPPQNEECDARSCF